MKVKSGDKILLKELKEVKIKNKHKMMVYVNRITVNMKKFSGKVVTVKDVGMLFNTFEVPDEIFDYTMIRKKITGDIK